MTYAALASTQRVRTAAAGRVPSLALGLSVGPLLAANGGYFPGSWGWAGVGIAWGAVLVAALGRTSRPSTLDLTFVGGLTAFAAWIALSMLWTASTTQTGLEVERTLVYVAGALAVVAIVGRDEVETLLAGIAIAMTAICAYALGTRLFPSGAHVGGVAGYRLSRPVGYWNGLGLVAGMATILVVVLAARAKRASLQALAAAAVPLLLTTLYFTFSRGAWLSLFAGLIVLLAVERRRLQLAGVVAPIALVSAAVLWRASTSTALTHTTATVAEASHQGKSLAAVVAAGAILAGYLAVADRRFEHRWLDSPTSSRTATWVLVAVAVLGVGVAIARFGSPITMGDHAYRSFVGSPVGGTNLNSRLFSLSNNGRTPAWHVAIHAFEAHPLAGIGGGGFEQYWDKHRTVTEKLRDTHNLYLQTLAEDGIIGLLILAAALIAPLVAFARARSRHPLAAAALAAYATFLIEAIADWDWQLSGITLAALLCAGAVLAAGRTTAPAGRWRALPLTLGTVVALAALVGLVGNLSLSASARAAQKGNWSNAVSDAKRAHQWAPWSAEPWEDLGFAQLGLGEKAAAADSFRAAIGKSSGDYQLWLDLAQVLHGISRDAALSIAQTLNPLDHSISQSAKNLNGSP